MPVVLDRFGLSLYYYKRPQKTFSLRMLFPFRIRHQEPTLEGTPIRQAGNRPRPQTIPPDWIKRGASRERAMDETLRPW